MMVVENEVGISPAGILSSILKEIYSSLSGRNKRKFRKTLRSINAYVHIYIGGVTIHTYSDFMIKLLLKVKSEPSFNQVVEGLYPQLADTNTKVNLLIEKHKSYVSNEDRTKVEECIRDLHDLIRDISSYIEDGKYNNIEPTLFEITRKSKELYEIGHSSLDVSLWLDVI